MEKKSLADELVERLHKGIVEFKFIKSDGTIRKARGTLSPDILPPYEEKDSRSSKKNDELVVYYDMDKNAFRCFKKNRLVIIMNN